MLQIYPLCRRVSDWRHFPEWLGILSRVVCHHGWQKILPGHCRHLCKTALLKLFLLRNREGWENVGNTFCLKGKLGNSFYWLKVFIGPKLRQVSKGNFHRKAPKWVKNQAKGSKIHKIRTKWHPTYCGNPSILSTDLLWEFEKCIPRQTATTLGSRGLEMKMKLCVNWYFHLWRFGQIKIIKAFYIVEEKVCWIYSGFPQ